MDIETGHSSKERAAVQDVVPEFPLMTKYNFVTLAFQGLGLGSSAIGLSNVVGVMALPEGALPQMAVGMCAGSASLGLLIAAIAELLQCNVFTGTIFGVYAGYYFSYLVIYLPSNGLLTTLSARELQLTTSIISFVYAVPTIFFFLGTLKQGLWIIRFLLLLAIGSCLLYGVGNAINSNAVNNAGGFFDIAIGLTSWYISFAMVYSTLDTYFKLPLF
ncbi:hypothetical protein DM01DRAFT_1342215 [Hesseltinella vesiculosa]|uniref:Uncharacterized protein n=1 Tax=Hesseltinella vesiculosa TaxID=101127 RepID=A0A1X2GWF4_9FUNG|nr:hypothetical protein DM01DRAFT_1342215 [Hesseltinella vesiculosa]